MGFALCHTAPLVEGRTREELRVLKLALARDEALDPMIHALCDFAKRSGTRRVALRVQGEYPAMYRALVALGARVRWTDLRMALAGTRSGRWQAGSSFAIGRSSAPLAANAGARQRVGESRSRRPLPRGGEAGAETFGKQARLFSDSSGAIVVPELEVQNHPAEMSGAPSVDRADGAENARAQSKAMQHIQHLTLSWLRKPPARVVEPTGSAARAAGS